MTPSVCTRLHQILKGRPDGADLQSPPIRVHVIGGAGTGKSTFAERLAGALSLRVYELDEVNFADGIARRRPRAERLAGVHRIAQEPAWIAEGIFVGWTDELLRMAELVIWLDLPAHIALSRIITRHIRTSLAGTNRYPGLRRLFAFLRWTIAYYRPLTPAAIDALAEEDLHSRAAVARHVGPYRNKLIRCSSIAEVADLLACLGELRGRTSSRSISNHQPGDIVESG